MLLDFHLGTRSTFSFFNTTRSTPTKERKVNGTDEKRKKMPAEKLRRTKIGLESKYPWVGAAVGIVVSAIAVVAREVLLNNVDQVNPLYKVCFVLFTAAAGYTIAKFKFCHKSHSQ